ncbi:MULTISPECIES: patatin-like phospholipase family protein [Vibrio]|uniref:Patatin family protein n=1 Tax=Vibrio cortegadensis TaxID=1328770 RepID=A0ABV4M2I7_9VIBR|nr:patatin-like phospholipase family protein [Vibrio sp. 03-59-1]NOH83264.1 patatin family protein [Vibrio sp. 03-59-1]RBW66497.1 patatin family protein [Vibrionales bacterium C3R12]
MKKNSGIITNVDSRIDAVQLSKYISGKTTLVAQGGGQRGIFTSGVIDALLLSNFDEFDEFYGTSAGALNLCAYLCRQHGLGKSFIMDLTTDPNFFNLFSYIRSKQPMDMEWALDRISEYPYKLDVDMGRRVLAQRKAYAAVTDEKNLSDAYLPLLTDNWYQVMIATCAIPRLYTKEIIIDSKHYIDGGVSASIPVQEAWRKEARNLVVIRTEAVDAAHKAIDDEEQSKSVSSTEIEWFRDSFDTIQEQWQSRMDQWRSDWGSFFQQQISRSKAQKRDHRHLDLLNGGRWLFGADDIYRLSHLVGDKFDSGLADMLMVHYQTYSLTQDFLNAPPDDAFVIQIAPAESLRSSSLMSKPEDLLFDYQMGVDAGYRFVEQYTAIQQGTYLNESIQK